MCEYYGNLKQKELIEQETKNKLMTYNFKYTFIISVAWHGFEK